MINKTRILSLGWWNSISIRDRLPIFRKYFSSGVTCLMDITEEDIEEIWKKETKHEQNRIKT